MHTDYISPVMRELRDQQVRYAPRDRKLEQMVRAERLLEELDPTRNYSYEYLCYRITDYRPEASPKSVLPGRDAVHDLRLFVEDVSDSADIPIDHAGEPVLTVEDLSKKFNVSTKTINRWRDQGLVSRRFVFDNRKRVGFLQSSVDRFVARNGEKIQRGEKFSQISHNERAAIIERARRLAGHGGCPSEVARRIAERLGRSVETIRYTIKQFDEQHPELAVFPQRTGPLDEPAKKRMYQEYRRGTTIDEIARQFSRTRTSVYRVVNEMRALRILELPLDYMHNKEFDRANAEAKIMGPMPGSDVPARKVRVPAGLPPYLASLYEVPLLVREQEYHLFRQYNYLKHQARKLREGLEPAKAKSAVMDRIENLYNAAVAVKNQIVQANLRLVVSIAKRHVNPTDDFFELVSDGNMSLIRAVEKFDYSRGNKFSTYASWAIMKNYARTIPDGFKQRDRFRSGTDEVFQGSADARTDQVQLENAQTLREDQVLKILSRLDEREQQIIISRFGLDHRQEPLTLKEVGEEMGVTKERVRQIEARALAKLKAAAAEDKIEDPE